MGIQGLLPLLKSIQKTTHLRHFAGQTLGVDAYGWLHRGAVSCALELVQGTPTRKHIDFALHRVRMLIHFGVKPYLVFDGDYLPSKAHTEQERASRRKESKKTGLELLRMGRKTQAYRELMKAVDVTPTMARELIEELNRLDVPYVVAPYEADSQLAYLEKQGAISGVISEDSDLLVFGVQCLLTKLDQYGECEMIKRADFTACRDISLVGWTDQDFRMMAMLSGCDYLPGIGKMGLKTAYTLVRTHKTIDRVIRSVQFDGKMRVPPGYLEAFQHADRTFLYQWVFCPSACCLKNLTPLPSTLEPASMPYIGKYVEPEIAAGVASGHLDPNTKRPITINSRSYRPTAHTRSVQTPDEKQGKPISEFFKPKRTPLAELDPNSFTPSPSQQRILETNENASWSASQIPGARPSSLSRSASLQAPSSAPPGPRRTVSAFVPSRTRGSPKRQRLCSDTSLVGAQQDSEESQSATSRFFPTKAQGPSPSLRKKSNKGKKEEFDLWSDDSTAEAIAATATPDLTQDDSVPTPRKRKKLGIFVDSQDPKPGVGSTDVSQQTASTLATEGSNTSKDGDAVDRSFQSVESNVERSIFSKGVEVDLAALRSEVDAAKANTAATEYKFGSSTSATLSSHFALSSASLEKTPCNPAPEIIPSSSPNVKIENHNDERPSDNNLVTDRSGSGLKKKLVDELENAKVQGSEDMLVPESPAKSDDTCSPGPVINLGRFAFAG